MHHTSGITGTGPTLEEAFEDAARQVANQLLKRGVEETDFSKRRYPARIEIEVQPHNQWVSAYKVILPGA